ncbi:unnamed protein product [Brassica oleracea]
MDPIPAIQTSSAPTRSRPRDTEISIPRTKKQEVGNEMAAAHEPEPARRPERKQEPLTLPWHQRGGQGTGMCAAPDGATDGTMKTH